MAEFVEQGTQDAVPREEMSRVVGIDPDRGFAVAICTAQRSPCFASRRPPNIEKWSAGRKLAKKEELIEDLGGCVQELLRVVSL